MKVNAGVSERREGEEWGAVARRKVDTSRPSGPWAVGEKTATHGAHEEVQGVEWR